MLDYRRPERPMPGLWHWFYFVAGGIVGVMVLAPVPVSVASGRDGFGIDASVGCLMMVAAPFGMAAAGAFLFSARPASGRLSFALWGLAAGTISGLLAVAVFNALAP